MAVLRGWNLDFDADAVLRGQGADPAILRARSPVLVQVADRALAEGRTLLDPQVVVRRMEVETLRHERLVLAGGAYLSGPLIAQHLGPARSVIVLVCTIGPALEDYAARVMADELVYGLALDGVGSAAVEALANAACRAIEEEVAAAGMQATIPLSPGMVGWTVEQGQSQIFALLDAGEIGIKLNASYIMHPRKSLSMVLGVGPDVLAAGHTCDYCAMRETCRYQVHYERQTL